MRRRQWQPTPVLLPGKSHGQRSLVGCSPWVAKSQIWLSDFTFTFHFHALEKEMATHSSVLAWRIPGTGEPGGLSSTGLHRVGHDWSDLASVCTCQPQSPRFFVNKVICGNVNWYSHCRNNMEPPSKTKNRTTIWPSNPISRHTSRENHNSKRYMQLSVHCSTIYNSQYV